MFAVAKMPPMIWPSTAPPDSTVAYRLIALARVPGDVYVRCMRLSTCGIIVAAPMPWRKRKPMSAPAEGARPQPSEASVNSAIPPRNMRRWPRMSPSRAPVTSSTA
jgi:hypothetical protein